MVTEVPKGTSVIGANVGQAIELALPFSGGTGFRWEASDCSGLHIERRGVKPSAGFGGCGRDLFFVTPNRTGDIWLNLQLRAPWLAEPAEVRKIKFEVR
ncbi:protease inhibitor I42 family protein [Acetobacter pasteurianus]|uniref:Proteinase inhibitor I42 chagasin domain-containing protein n=2 Tax=Acetobacter pasteurianus TaxID=438 RepID=A0A401WWR8_ACEPA|nr:protease inhibitor I42 family protein [Acetobacter pasteurianus]ARW47395.1 hypothetical protein S1001342_01049 [Acetobacter pasteurianus subsp. pasteurianus]GCD53724.1 hypothetical protein NBRC3188_2421 [Acetobacter pasteurianus NBRC 3188]